MIKSKDILDALSAKEGELMAQYEASKAADKAANKYNRQARALRVISALIEYIDEDEFEIPCEDELMQMIDCKKGKAIRLELAPGMMLADVLAKCAIEHPNLNYKKIKAKIEAQGYKVVLDHIELA